MTEGGFHESRRISPTGLVIVVAVHAAAITALALSKMEVEQIKIFTPIQVEDIRLPPEPEPLPPPPEPKPQPRTRSEVTYVPPLVPSPPTSNLDLPVTPTLDPPVFDAGPIGKADTPPMPRIETAPTPDPVRVEARMRSGDLQPPYPAGEQRAGKEGSVRVRVTIGADGRVKAVEKVSATSDAFFRATQRHALRAWRFAPATLAGRPTESVKTLTVQFRLD